MENIIIMTRTMMIIPTEVCLIDIAAVLRPTQNSTVFL